MYARNSKLFNFSPIAAAILSVSALWAIASLYLGVVLCIMWKWFVTPLGVPSISVAHAIGLVLTVGLFRLSTRQKDESPPKSKVLMIDELIVPLVILLIGAVIHYGFM